MIRERATAMPSRRLAIGKQLDRYAIPALSLVGMAISAYLTYVKLASTQVLCIGGSGGCDVVQNSSYAQIMGVPVALLGFLGTLALFAVSTWRLKAGMDDPNVALALFGLALFALLFCAYLTYIELFVLQSI